MVIGFEEIEDLSRIDSQQAAHLVPTKFEKAFPGLILTQWQEIQENIRNSGNLIGSVNGYTLLHACIQYGHELASLLLIEKGSDIHITDKEGWTTLHFAAAHGNETLVKTLIERGAGLESRCNVGSTALIKAAEYGHVAVVQQLLKSDANVDVQDTDGHTPLMKAAKRGYDAIVAHLIHYGANTNLQQKDGKTALVLAAEQRRHTTEQLLQYTMLAISSCANPRRKLTGLDADEVHLGKRKTQYRATCISATVDKLALIDKYDFTIFSVPSNGPIEIVCYGKNDGSFGKTLSSTHTVMHDLCPRSIAPTYKRGIMTGHVLCIACREGCVDIHDAVTGQLIDSIDLERGDICWDLAISPSGRILAIILDTGEVLLYALGMATANFISVPVPLFKPQDGTDLRMVSCVAFSRDSAYLSVCTYDNVIRTYDIGHPNTPVWVSTHDRKLVEKKRHEFEGVTSLSLYHGPSKSC